jgi:hypothetical protein
MDRTFNIRSFIANGLRDAYAQNRSSLYHRKENIMIAGGLVGADIVFEDRVDFSEGYAKNEDKIARVDIAEDITAYEPLDSFVGSLIKRDRGFALIKVDYLVDDLEEIDGCENLARALRIVVESNNEMTAHEILELETLASA